METFIAFITPYIPTIIAIFSNVVLIVAGLMRFGNSLEKFQNSKEIKELRTKMAAMVNDNDTLRRINAEQLAEYKNLCVRIDQLLKSDEFLAHREKQDFTELLSLYRQLNLLYSNMLAANPTLCDCDCDKDKTEEVKNDGTNNEETPQ